MPDLRSLRCVVYRRVSTERQAGEVYTSLEDQDRACRELAAKLGLTIGHVYTDDGFSGATIEQRPAMRELIADCRAAERRRDPAYVLVLNDSRWGRFPNPEEATYWRFELERHGWLVRFAENDDTENKPVRALMRALVAGQATQKREDVKANAKRGMKGTVDRGFWCSQAPFGYRRKVVYPPGRERVLDTGMRKAIDEKIALTPHEAEAKIVRELFARFATGEHSTQSLIEWLKGVSKERVWKHAIVRTVLTNPAYVGDIVFGRVPSDRSERAIHPTRDRADWYVKRQAHPAIVDRALFDRVQELLERNRRTTRGVRSDWILSGIVRCRCGAHMISGGGGRRGRRHGDGHFEPSYRCSTINKAKGARCPFGGSIAKSTIERAVIQTIANEASTPVAQSRILAFLDEALDAARSTPTTELDALRRERAAVAQRRERVLDAIEAGTVKGADAKARLEKLSIEDTRLLAQIEAMATRAADETIVRADRDRLAQLLSTLPKTMMELSGPALRELVRPWVKDAVFNTDSRVLRLEIRHIPRFSMLSDPMGMPARACTGTAGTDTERRSISRATSAPSRPGSEASRLRLRGSATDAPRATCCAGRPSP